MHDWLYKSVYSDEINTILGIFEAVFFCHISQPEKLQFVITSDKVLKKEVWERTTSVGEHIVKIQGGHKVAHQSKTRN